MWVCCNQREVSLPVITAMVGWALAHEWQITIFGPALQFTAEKNCSLGRRHTVGYAMFCSFKQAAHSLLVYKIQWHY